MAEDSDGASKSEEATPRKLEEARRKGDVAKSPDLPSWASLAGAAGVALAMGGPMAQDLAAQLTPFIEHPDRYELQDGGAAQVLHIAINAAFPIILAVMSAAAFGGAAGNLLQTGFMFSTEKLMPDPSRLSLVKGFQRMFGLDGFIQFIKSFLKIALVSVVCWFSLKPHAAEFQQMAALDPLAMLPLALAMLKTMFFAVLALLGAGAMIDWLVQRQRFMARMRMTKEEVKEDYRQSEGDPHVKGKQKQMRMERAKRRMMQNVPKATVVLMNPTHYAVALRYVQGETPAPLCVAKGIDSLAFKIREVAEANNVPVIEDAPLARALYASVEIDQSIPREHFEAVAKVIGFVLQAARRRQTRRAPR